MITFLVGCAIGFIVAKILTPTRIEAVWAWIKSLGGK